MAVSWFVLVFICVVFVFAFGIGGQDDTMAIVSKSGLMKVKHVVLLGGALAIVGSVLLSANVGRTIGERLLGDAVQIDVAMLTAILLSTSLWMVLALLSHAPVSVTQSVVGAVVGVTFVWALHTGHPYAASVNWLWLGLVVLGWLVTPLLGLVGGYYFYRLVNRFTIWSTKGLLEVEKYERTYGGLILAATVVTQVSKGGNDTANAVSFFFGLVRAGTLDATHIPALQLAVGIAFMLGLVLVGRKVIRSVMNTTEGTTRPSEAFAIQITMGTIILAATLLGLPISGSQIMVCALIGSARARGERHEREVLNKMVRHWLVTIPASMVFSAMIYAFFLL